MTATHPSHLTVLQSFPVPRPTTNPYLVMLAASLRATPGVRVINFTWREALFGRYDVFHVHWPEILVDGRSAVKKAARQAFTILLLVKLRAGRVPIVRTLHNLERPQGISRLENFLLDRLDRQTSLSIRLNESSEVAVGDPVVTIAHGHYREWFADHPIRSAVRGQLGYVGLIRRYKGVEGLVEAFHELASTEEGLSLRIGGKPSTPELADTIRSLTGADERISLELNFLSDAELVDIVTSSEVVVLPYRFMHNSGGALAALSLNRPILVPDSVVNRNLASEVGSGWVLRFEGALTGERIREALTELRARPGVLRPDLDARSWDRAGPDHRDAYLQAIAITRAAARR